jgi:hypothetical protein
MMAKSKHDPEADDEAQQPDELVERVTEACNQVQQLIANASKV